MRSAITREEILATIGLVNLMDLAARELEFYPVALRQDRYGGCYSGGKWVAMVGDGPTYKRLELGDQEAFHDDPSAMEFWDDPPANVAADDSPTEALRKAMLGRLKELEA